MSVSAPLRGATAQAARAVRRAVARLTGRDVATVRPVGARIRVDPTTEFGGELLRSGARASEPFLVPAMQRILGPGDTMLDVGAHWGTYAVSAARLVGPSGRVIAVEPFRPSARRLAANVRLNRLGNVVVVAAAVGEREGAGYLVGGGSGDNLATLQAAAPGHRIGFLPAAVRRGLGLTVANRCRIATLPGLLAEHAAGRVALLKMDIEGSERLALRRLPEVSAVIEAVLVELHPPFPGGARDEEELYAELTGGRDLLVAEAGRGAFVPVETLGAFRAALGDYYFLSVVHGSRFARGGQASFEGFRWA